MSDRTCDGRCCAVFPLSWAVAGPDGIASRTPLLNSIPPLEHRDATMHGLRSAACTLPRLPLWRGVPA